MSPKGPLNSELYCMSGIVSHFRKHKYVNANTYKAFTFLNFYEAIIIVTIIIIIIIIVIIVAVIIIINFIILVT